MKGLCDRLIGILLAVIPLAVQGTLEAGRLLYTQGQTQFPATATVASGIRVPLKGYPCRACHGDDGRGGREGGVVIPAINWHALITVIPATRPAYTPATLVRAITQGIAVNGRELNGLMPRYQLQQGDLKHLLDYLRYLDRPVTPGVDPGVIRIGTLVPDQGPMAPLGKVVVQVLAAFFDRVNTQGGIYQRRLQLVTHAGEGRVSASLDDDNLFCLLSPIFSDDGSGASAFSADLPVLFPLGSDAPGMNSLGLLANLTDQARTLFAWWLQKEKNNHPGALLVIEPSDTRIRETVRSLVEGTDVGLEILDSGSRDFPALIETGLSQGSGALFWFSDPEQLPLLIEKLASRPNPIDIYTPVDLIAQDLDELTRHSSVRLIVTDPRGSPETESQAYMEFIAFQTQLPNDIRRHVQLVRYAYTAAALLEEGLKRAGRRFSRRSLLERMQQIHTFHSGAMPPVSLAPHLTKPSRILIYSPAAHRFQEAAGWVGTE